MSAIDEHFALWLAKAKSLVGCKLDPVQAHLAFACLDHDKPLSPEEYAEELTMKRDHRGHRRKIKAAELTPIVDAGREYYKLDPDALLISVARKAAAQYASKHDQLAFLNGYQQARLRHEEFKMENGQ